jgi:hypothetical protein
MPAKRKYAADRAMDDIGRDPDTLELFEMANLTQAETGVAGIIYVSTQQGRHAARVKWYPSRPTSRLDDCLSVTVADDPKIFNHGLPKFVESGIADTLRQWVRLNQTDLLDFWRDGWTWTRAEVSAFFDRLKKV